MLRAARNAHRQLVPTQRRLRGIQVVRIDEYACPDRGQRLLALDDERARAFGLVELQPEKPRQELGLEKCRMERIRRRKADKWATLHHPRGIRREGSSSRPASVAGLYETSAYRLSKATYPRSLSNE